MVYEKCKVRGPYKNPRTGREWVHLIYPDGKINTKSYPRYIYEMRSGRYLKKDETIDHLDSNFLNNKPENLQVKSRSQHVIEDVKRVASQMFKCPLCGYEFVLSCQEMNKRNWKNRNQAGPFCSRSCAGKYGNQIKSGFIEPFPVRVITKEYYTLKSLFRENSCHI